MVLELYYQPPDQESEGDMKCSGKIRDAAKMGQAMIMGDFDYHQRDWVNIS